MSPKKAAPKAAQAVQAAQAQPPGAFVAVAAPAALPQVNSECNALMENCVSKILNDDVFRNAIQLEPLSIADGDSGGGFQARRKQVSIFG